MPAAGELTVAAARAVTEPDASTISATVPRAAVPRATPDGSPPQEAAVSGGSRAQATSRTTVRRRGRNTSATLIRAADPGFHRH
nr:hypothetical protein GCM10020092_045720 [Actinoplanes digitatis]